jgi:tRNA-dihydrouridine synthase 3
MRICRCKGSHDLLAYLQIKPVDLHIPTSLDTTPPFVSYGYKSLEGAYGSFTQCPGASSFTRCPYFDEFGECKVGFKCRFLGAHFQSIQNAEGDMDIGLFKEVEKVQFAKKSFAELNGVDSGLMKTLRKREVSSNYG